MQYTLKIIFSISLFIISVPLYTQELPLTTSLQSLLHASHQSTKERIRSKGAQSALGAGTLLILDSVPLAKQQTMRSSSSYSLLFYGACAIGALSIAAIIFDYLNSLYAAKQALYHFSNTKKELFEMQKLIKELKKDNGVYTQKQQELEALIKKTQQNAAQAQESMGKAEKSIQNLVNKLSEDFKNVAYLDDVALLRSKVNELEDLLRQLSLSHLQQSLNNTPSIQSIEQKIAMLSSAAERFTKTETLL